MLTNKQLDLLLKPSKHTLVNTADYSQHHQYSTPWRLLVSTVMINVVFSHCQCSTMWMLLGLYPTVMVNVVSHCQCSTPWKLLLFVNSMVIVTLSMFNKGLLFLMFNHQDWLKFFWIKFSLKILYSCWFTLINSQPIYSYTLVRLYC